MKGKAQLNVLGNVWTSDPLESKGPLKYRYLKACYTGYITLILSVTEVSGLFQSSNLLVSLPVITIDSHKARMSLKLVQHTSLLLMRYRTSLPRRTASVWLSKSGGLSPRT